MRNVLATLFVASLVAAGVTAQGQQSTTPSQQQPATQTQQPTTQPPATRGQQPATTQAAKVTISGCIQAATAAPSGAAAPAAAAPKFELANAKVVSGGPVGTTGAAAAARYRLEGDEKTITPHLNHQVEIMGSVSPAAPAAGASAMPPMLKVESVKMVAAKCL